MSIYNKRIVVVAEKRIINNQMDMFSNELDFSSEKVTDDILENLHKLGFSTSYYPSPKEFLDHISLHKNDIVFSNLWGGWHSRNKRSFLAAICEAYGICYIGADAFVHSLCQDKYLSKSFLKNFEFSIPKAVEINDTDELYKIDTIDYYPCIIKPNDEGCSVGISDHSTVTQCQEAKTLAKELLTHYSPVLVEEYIPGQEISICCAGVGHKVDILEAILLQVSDQDPSTSVWGCESKKLGKSVVTRTRVTSKLPASLLQEAERLFLSLGKVDCMRIDGKWYNEHFYVIELSPDCSLHQDCFMAAAFKYNGFSYSDMLEKLITNALNQHAKT